MIIIRQKEYTGTKSIIKYTNKLRGQLAEELKSSGGVISEKATKLNQKLDKIIGNKKLNAKIDKNSKRIAKDKFGEEPKYDYVSYRPIEEKLLNKDFHKQFNTKNQ